MGIDVPAAYALGRELGVLQSPYQAQDLTFGATRLDGQTVQGGDFRHCTFANVSFKGARLQTNVFLNCVFIGCYFRRAELVDSSFVGCRFIDCNFNHVAIKGSRFQYSAFQGCQLPFEELVHSLPPEPNIREALARNLYLESTRMGLSSEARRYRMAEIRAREDHLSAAILARSQWYQEHFDVLARFRAVLQLAASFINRWLWGYGERAWVLVRNVLILALLVFPIAYYLLRGGITKSASGPVNFWDVVQFSIANIVPSGIEPGLQAVALAPRVVAGVEAVFGVVTIALFASYVFRWSLHR